MGESMGEAMLLCSHPHTLRNISIGEMRPSLGSGLSIVRRESSDALPSFASFSVFASFSRSEAPSFPPVSELLASLRALPWESLKERALSSFLFALALTHALSSRLWQERRSLAPFLRSFASFLLSLADRLPEPLSSSSPRALLIEALMEKGESLPSLKKASRASLLRLAHKRGLLR